MYIVIDGVHGIGKTTLCKKLSNEKEFEYIPEIRDKHLPPPVLGPKSSDKLKSQLWFLRQMVLKDQKIRSSSGIVISDRGPISVLVYSKQLLPNYEFELIKTILSSLNLKEPDMEIVLWAPEEIILERVKGRARENEKKWSEDDLDYIKKINKSFRDYYEGFKDVNPIYLVDYSGSVKETCEKIQKIIRENFNI